MKIIIYLTFLIVSFNSHSENIDTIITNENLENVALYCVKDNHILLNNENNYKVKKNKQKDDKFNSETKKEKSSFLNKFARSSRKSKKEKIKNKNDKIGTDYKTHFDLISILIDFRKPLQNYIQRTARLDTKSKTAFVYYMGLLPSKFWSNVTLISPATFYSIVEARSNKLWGKSCRMEEFTDYYDKIESGNCSKDNVKYITHSPKYESSLSHVIIKLKDGYVVPKFRNNDFDIIINRNTLKATINTTKTYPGNLLRKGNAKEIFQCKLVKNNVLKILKNNYEIIRKQYKIELNKSFAAKSKNRKDLENKFQEKNKF